MTFRTKLSALAILSAVAVPLPAVASEIDYGRAIICGTVFEMMRMQGHADTARAIAVDKAARPDAIDRRWQEELGYWAETDRDEINEVLSECLSEFEGLQ